MIRETFPVGVLGCNCTILGDETSREAIIVDPGYNTPKILAALANHQLTAKLILVTHAHIDHIASATDLKAIVNAPLMYHKRDLPLVRYMPMQAGWLGVERPTVGPPDHSPRHHERVGVAGIEGFVLLTPGHTDGSLCLYLPSKKVLLTGDTLFAGGIGSTDLPGSNSAKLWASIQESLLPLPPETLVIPGHGPDTTIGREAGNISLAAGHKEGQPLYIAPHVTR